MHGRQGRYREIRGVFLDLEAVVGMEVLEEPTGKHTLRVALTGGTYFVFAPRKGDPDDYAWGLYEELVYQIAGYEPATLDAGALQRAAARRDARENVS